jgi:hypothetical protein
MPALLGETPGEITSMTADGACGGEPVYQAVAHHQPDLVPDIGVPPRASAVPSAENISVHG